MKHSQRNIGWNLSVVERYRFGFILGALLLLCAVLSLSLSSSASALTTVPTKMNFQGRLTDSTGNIKPNGTYNMKLRLYTVNSGGTAVWTEDRLVSAGNGVTVTNGLFSIQLGSVTSLPASLFASGALYLEVELPTPATATTSGTPTWTEGAMTPRNQMATSAYAYNAETLDGKDSADFGQLVASNTWAGAYNIFNGEVQINAGLLPVSVTADEIAFFPGTNGFTVSGDTILTGGTLNVQNDTTIYRNSTSAFRIQNTAGSNLLAANTSSMNVTVSGGSQTTFAKSWGGAGSDTGRGVALASDGGYVVTGVTASYGAGGNDAYLTKYSNTGYLEWTRTYGGTGDDQGTSVTTLRDGSYLMSGNTNSVGAGNYDAFIAKYTSSGTLQWSKTWGGTTWELSLNAAATSDGGFVMTGNSQAFSAGGTDTMLVKFDASGKVEWTRMWGGAADEEGRQVIQTADNDYVVVGFTDSYGAGGRDMFILRFSPSGGLLWNRTWGGTGADAATRVLEDRSSGFLSVFGETASYGAGNTDIVKVDLMSSGSLWGSTTYGGPGNDYAPGGVEKDASGALLMTGRTSGYGAGGDDAYTMKVSWTVEWARTIGGTGNESASGMVALPDKSFAIAGTTTSFGTGGSMLFAKYDSSGNIGGCSAPTCQTISPTTSAPSVTLGTPNASASSPAVTAGTTLATVNSPSATSADIVAISYGIVGLSVSGESSFGSNATFSGLLTTSGAFLSKASTDRTDAFTIQNSAAQTLFSVDTTSSGSVKVAEGAGGIIGKWKNGPSLPGIRQDAASVTVNGYVYVIGGSTDGSNPGAQSSVYYSRLNADGSPAAWLTATPLPGARTFLSAVALNGYIYAIGGMDASATTYSTVYYAKVQKDGTLGAWTLSANTMPQARYLHSSTTANGYLYTVAGSAAPLSNSNTVYYAKVNTDGSVGTWAATTALGDSFTNGTSFVSGGRLFVIGGFTSSFTSLKTVRSAPLNASNGTVGTWENGNDLAYGFYEGNTFIANGHVHLIDGTYMQSAKLGNDGLPGSWYQQSRPSGMPYSTGPSPVVNGYGYILGVNDASTTTAYVSLGASMQINASLDLVGLQGGSLTDVGDGLGSSAGGSITAGSITAVGSLQVQGQASLNGNVSVMGDFTAGNGIFSVENGSSVVRIGSSTADATGVVLVLDTKNTAGDPTGVTGAMYYNSSLGRFRCYGATKWVDCRTSAASNTATSSVTNTTTETQFTGAYGAEANECVPGRMYRITARGTYSQAALATNLTMKIKWGTAILASTGAQAMGATAMTNQQWSLSGDVVCQTTGTTGTVEAAGDFVKHTSSIASVRWSMANTAPVTVNTTTAANIAVTAQWSVANASNSITLRTLTINSLDNGN